MLRKQNPLFHPQLSCYDCWKEWDAQQTKAIVAILEQHFAEKRKKLPIFPSRAVLGGNAKPQEEVPGGELFDSLVTPRDMSDELFPPKGGIPLKWVKWLIDDEWRSL